MDELAFDINESVVIKDDDLFLVAQSDASMPIEGPHPFGLYFSDCRFMSGWVLEIQGEHPRSLVCSATAGNCATHELTNKEVGLQVRIQRALTGGRALDEWITLRSFEPEPVRIDVVLRLAAPFEPMMWIRGLAPDFKPKRPRTTAHDTGLTFEVTGHDKVVRRLVTSCRPAPDSARGAVLRWSVGLSRGRPQTIALRHAASEDAPARKPKAPPRQPRASGERPTSGTAFTQVRTSDELFNRVIERSFADLSMLRSRLDGERYFAAGIPWYATLFGRDTLITSLQMLAYDRGIAEQTLRLLASNLGTSVAPEREEEPGKVLHELRVGELANLGRLPFARYYGTVDATPLFLCLLAEHADWAGDLALFHELAHEVDAALAWIDEWGDRDADGLLEYERATPDGLQNQGWKDSYDGIPDARGRPLTGSIALVEVQGYAMRAKRRLARLFEMAGQVHRADRLREQAVELRERIERFWLAREGFYGLALDGDKHVSAALASNQGHLLWSLAVAPERAAGVRDALMRPEMFCGWGVRTLASSEPGYNPIGYHVGSVWPHDTAMIAFGLRKYGYDEDFTRIFEGLLEAASRFPDYRLPELFGGFSRDEYEVPVPYPVACHPQAWAAGAIPYLLRAGLGLVPDALQRRLRVVRPSLPVWLDHVEVSGLRLADARIDLTFERTGDRVTLGDVRIEGEAEVTLEISGSREPDFGF